MAFNSIIILPLRLTQALFAIIVLGVLAYSAHDWTWGHWSPDEINFLIFCSVWYGLISLSLPPLNISLPY
jgi:hypothetical protein